MNKMNNTIAINKVLVVFGTRPEAIKMCPLILELKKRPKLTTLLCVTGQHRQMLDQVLDAFKLTPDYDLSIMRDNQTLFDITSNVLEGMKNVLEKVKPDLVLVHGDTTTTFATALAAYYLLIPVGHVEAGLRTYNTYSPYPEEFNREAVGTIASFNFAPTVLSADNLLCEGKHKESVFITGNTAIDALKTTVRDDYTHAELEWASDSRLVLITAHRRENLGQPMHNMFRAIKRVLDEHKDVKAIYPIHLNPAVRQAAIDVFGENSNKGNRLHIIEPLDVIDFHNFMKRSYVILTDSGGIQEEAPSLGKPVLVMRDTTERPEGIEAGTLKLVGTNEDVIYEEFTKLLDNQDAYNLMAQASNPYGDGHACERIADVIEKGSCQEFQVSQLKVAMEKMTNDALRVAYFMDNYDLIAHEVPASYDKNRTVADPLINEHKYCRFCGKSDEDVKFSQKAHAISELIGNKKLYLDNECDECNQFFGGIVEDSFAKYLGISRTLSQTKGKNGYPSFKSKDGKFRMDVTANGTVIQATNDCDIAKLGETSIDFYAEREKYYPVDAYRTLVKAALSVIPFSEILSLIPTYVWLRADRREDIGKQMLSEWESLINVYAGKVIEVFIPGPKPLPLQIWVFRRKSRAKDKVPYCIAILEFDNYRYQYILPAPNQDGVYVGNVVFNNIKTFLGEEEVLPEYQAFVTKYGTPTINIVDLGNHEFVEGEKIHRRLGFGKKVPQSVENAEKFLRDHNVKRLAPKMPKNQESKCLAEDNHD